MTDIPVPQSPQDASAFANGIDANGNLTFSRVGVEDINYSGRFGALGYSTTENEISIGTKYFVLNVDEGKFRVGDDILMTSQDDRDCFMWGEIIGKDTVWEPVRLLVYVDDISDLTNISQNWELQVVARPKPGIEKDTSTTSVDPTDGGPWTFTVTAGKFFPIGGTLLIKPTTDRSIAVIGEVAAYNSTSLTVTLRATNAAVSQAYTSWSIALLDSPPAKLPQAGIVGLRVDISNIDDTNNPITISPGSVMDSTGTLLLQLSSSLVKNLGEVWAAGTGNGGAVRTLLSGTVSNSVTSITGSGTSFTTDFVVPAKMNDYENSGGTRIPYLNCLISVSGDTSFVETITDDTHLTTEQSLTSSGSAYYRGGIQLSTQILGDWFILLIRKDLDGTIDAAFCSGTPSGEPDLPSGYTYYRVIAQYSKDVSTEWLEHHIHNNAPYAPYDVFMVGRVASLSMPNSYYMPTVAHSQLGVVFPEFGTIGVDPYLVFNTSPLSGDVTSSANSFTTTIANDAVTNAKLANMAAYTLKGRNAGTTGDPSDIDITALTEQTSPTTTDFLIGVDTAASNAFKKYKASNFGGGTTFPADMGLITESASVTFDCGTIT